jgi:hypothetical protein
MGYCCAGMGSKTLLRSLLALTLLLSCPAYAEKVTQDPNAPGVEKPAPAGAVGPLPRICARDGKFVEKGSNKEFRPVGFQYIRILPEGPHYVFAPSKYDAARVEAMLADLQKNGFNIVRVFVGAYEITAGEGLSEAFFDKVSDFIERATRHKVYVLPVVDWIPGCSRYESIRAKARRDVDGMQRLFLDPATMEAKSLYLKDFVSMVKKRCPRLMSTIFAYELENEVCIDTDKPPFSQATGTFTYAQKSYDLADERSLQELLDTAIIGNSNKLAAAIRSVDPEAMVAYSVFTYAAVGRTGPGKLRTDKSPDKRCPLRPLALAKSGLSYVDIHFYGPAPDALDRDLRSVEWDELKSVCRAKGKPILAGEYGVPSPMTSDGKQAAYVATWFLQNLLSKGVKGGIFWTYDCDEQSGLRNSKQFDGAIFKGLAELNKSIQAADGG